MRILAKNKDMRIKNQCKTARNGNNSNANHCEKTKTCDVCMDVCTKS